MKFKKLLIRNFMGVGRIDLNLDRGLFVISGKNLDDASSNSNGSGKSTIADAIFWVLYGKTARGDGADDVINKVAKKNCIVTIVVEDDGNEYEITRWRKCTDKLFKNGLKLVNVTHNINLSKNITKDTQRLIDDFLGCSSDVFVNSIYMAQDALPSFPSMSDTALKELIESAIGLDRMATIYSSVLSDLNITEAELSIAEAKLQSNQSFLELQEESIKLISEQMRKAKERLDKRIAEKQTRLSETRKHNAAVSEKIKKEEAWLETTKRSLELASLDAHKIADMRGVLRQNVEHCRERVQKYTNALRQDKQHMQSLIQAKDTAQSWLDDDEHKKCNQCGRPYDKQSYENAKNTVTEKLEKLEELISRQELFVFEKERELSSAKGSVQQIEENLASTADKLTVAQEAARVHAASVQQSSISIEKLKASIIQEAAISDEIEALKGALEPIQASLDDALKRKSDLVATVNEHSSHIKVLKGRLASLRVQKSVFGPTGVRIDILNSVTPFLNERTQYYLAYLSNNSMSAVWTTQIVNKSGNIREKFTVNVIKTLTAVPYKSLSGGEKRKARLACALALQDLVAQWRPNPFRLWIGDEIDDGLDQTGLEALMQIMKERSREEGAVMLISHHSLDDWVNDRETVVMKNGQAALE